MRLGLSAFPSAGGLWLAAVAGGLHAFSVAWPGSGQAHGWLQVLSLALLASSLCRLAVSALPLGTVLVGAAWRTAVFAVTWLASTFWWLHVSMHQVGGLPAPLSVAAVLLLASALGLYYVTAATAWVALVRLARWGARPLAESLLFAALWLLAELLRGHWFTGFPWGAGGYAHVDGWLASAAPWVGVYGIGAMAAFMAMRLALLRGRYQRRWQAIALLALLLAGVRQLPDGDHFTRSAGTLEVELLQANIAQTDKFEATGGIRDALAWYGERLLASRQPLVIAPETAIPLLPRHLPPGYWPALQAHFGQGQQLALVGVPWGDALQGYSNSLVALGPQGLSAYRYDKAHLVPFGEFIPTGFGWFVRQMQIPLGDFVRGSVHPPSIEWQGQRLAPNICYEDLFGEELAARFAASELPPTVLVNVSNIAWFGDTIAVDQHLNISRMRALELGRPMLRATNTGATAIIDHRGRVQGLLPRFTRGSLTGTFEGRTGLTPYARWVAAFGLWPLWGLALLVLAWAAACARRR
ncbi:MAG: apolipoprotein N-acyltransferase [Limnohabitans sp.]